MYRKFIILVLVFVLCGCKIKFRDQDLVCYNAFTINDTLSFSNNAGSIRRIVITGKQIINKGWDENTRGYNPQVAHVKYKDLSIPDSVYYRDDMITIWQNSPTEIEETILFNGFLGTLDRKTQKTGELRVLNEPLIYKVPKWEMETVREPTDIAYVYWSDKTGILAYDYKGGERWTLIK